MDEISARMRSLAATPTPGYGSLQDYVEMQNFEQARLSAIAEGDKQENARRLAEEPVRRVQASIPTAQATGLLRGSLNPATGRASVEAIQPSPSNTLAKMMAEVSSEQSPELKLNRLFEIRSAYESQINAYKAAAFTQAEQELQVPQLKQALARAQQLDRSDPRWGEFQTDSPETGQTRAQYQSALAAASQLADKHFLRNEEVGRLKGMIEPFLAIQQKSYEKLTMKGDMDAAAAEDLRMKLGDNPINLSKVVAPTADPVKHAVANINNKDYYATVVAMNEPAQLLPMAIDGNQFSKQMLIEMQATAVVGKEKVGTQDFVLAKDQAMKDVNLLTKMTEDEGFFQKVYSDYYKNPEVLAEKMKKLGLPDNSKEGVAARKLARFNLATEYLADQRQTIFLANVNSWAGSQVFHSPDSSLGKIYATVKQRTGTDKISLDSIIGEISGLPKETQPQAMNELMAVSSNAMKAANSGIYGQFGDSIDMSLILAAKLRSRAAAKAMETLGSAPSVIGRGIENLFTNGFPSGGTK